MNTPPPTLQSRIRLRRWVTANHLAWVVAALCVAFLISTIVSVTLFLVEKHQLDAIVAAQNGHIASNGNAIRFDGKTAEQIQKDGQRQGQEILAELNAQLLSLQSQIDAIISSLRQSGVTTHSPTFQAGTPPRVTPRPTPTAPAPTARPTATPTPRPSPTLCLPVVCHP